MRKYFGGVLLLGALAITSLAAQRAPSVPRGYLEVALTYNPVRSNAVGNSGLWMQGASAQLEGHFWRGLGVVADVAGTHAKNISSSGVGLDMVRATFGPRYTWLIPHRRLSIFAQGLLGEANGSACAQSRPTGSALSCRTALLVSRTIFASPWELSAASVLNRSPPQNSDNYVQAGRFSTQL